MDASTTVERPVVTRFGPWWVLAVLCLGFFMNLLDTTIVNIAVPNLVDSLDATLDQALWVLNAYTLVYAVLLITGGRLGDLFGQKRLFLAGLTVFTLASAACGFAQTPAELILARMAQGVGGAMLTPQTLALLTMIFPPSRRGAAYGVWGGVAGLATITGPTLGGWLVTNWSWRWIFYVNLPVGALTLILAAVILPDLRLNRRHRLDWPGTALVSVGLFLLCFGLIEGQSHRWGRVWGPITIPMVLVAGVGALALFCLQQYQHRDREPLVPLEIFVDRNFAVMSAVVAAISFGMLGLFFPLVIFLQAVVGLSALQAGLVLAPMSIASIASAPFAGRLADRYGGRGLLVTGLCIWALGMAFVLGAARILYDRSELITGLIIAGFGLGMTFAPLQTIAMRNVAPRMAGAAAGVINMSRQLGAVIGSAAVGALLQSQLAAQLAESSRRNADGLPIGFRQHFIDGFAQAASKGLQVGVRSTGVHLPADIPQSVRPGILQIAAKTFHEAYTAAMRVTLILPLCVLAAAALAVLLVRPDRPRASASAQPEPLAPDSPEPEPMPEREEPAHR
jgi:EmrB/QacA subfamily drug resistance transporter